MTDAKVVKKVCGIVMPISECDGRPPHHWADVLRIIEAAATQAGFTARLVSDTFESNLIHKEIISNIYNDDIIVCDVSGRNPNVFFELGIRMATQKPTVIVKDDRTAYPFDTGPNRYIEYPRDLRHPAMEAFKAQLIDAIQKTVSHSTENSFIGQLGPFHIPVVENKDTPISDIILERIDALERRMISHGGIFSPEASLGLATTLPVFNGRYIKNSSIRVIKISKEEMLIETRGFQSSDVSSGLDSFLTRWAHASARANIMQSENDRVTIALRAKGVPFSTLFDSLCQEIDDVIPF